MKLHKSKMDRRGDGHAPQISQVKRMEKLSRMQRALGHDGKGAIAWKLRDGAKLEVRPYSTRHLAPQQIDVIDSGG